MKVIFVSRFEPVPIGDGGNHRTYQIVKDLTAVLGEKNVAILSWSTSYEPTLTGLRELDVETSSLLRRLYRSVQHMRLLRPVLTLWGRTGIGQARRRFAYLRVEHPVDLLAHQSGISNRYDNADFIALYQSKVTATKEPIACFIDHVGFSRLIELNNELGIPTVFCPQNIEALDEAIPLSAGRTREIYFAGLALADEIVAMAKCEARLLISKTETAFVNGLGFFSRYYPYRPVGAIRDRLMKIRSERQKRTPEPGLFLLLGSAAHNTTGWSFSWFVQQAANHGLPSGVRVVVGGRGTEAVVSYDRSVTGLEVRGWLAQDELDALFTRVCAVLVPQMLGFGALTRLAELSCAGIPAIVSEYATWALDPPPGLRIVANDWEHWYEGMAVLSVCPDSITWEAYQQWEDMQRSPVQDLLVGLS